MGSEEILSPAPFELARDEVRGPAPQEEDLSLDPSLGPHEEEDSNPDPSLGPQEEEDSNPDPSLAPQEEEDSNLDPSLGPREQEEKKEHASNSINSEAPGLSSTQNQDLETCDNNATNRQRNLTNNQGFQSPAQQPINDARYNNRIWRLVPPVNLTNIVVLISIAFVIPWRWLEHFSSAPKARRHMVPFVVGRARLTEGTGFKVTFTRLDDDEEVLRGDLGLAPKTRSSSKMCDGHGTQDRVSCTWKVGTEMRMSQVATSLPQLQCTRHVWVGSMSTDMLKDCFQMGDAHWYGAGEYFFKSWSTDNKSQDEAAFITGDVVQTPDAPYRSVEERFWLSSKGVAIYVSPLVPLFVSINKRKRGWLCLMAKNCPPYAKTKKKPKLVYTVCVGKDIAHTYRQATKLLFKHPRRMLDSKIFKHPIWATGAKYGKHVTQDNITQFARAIVHHHFPYSLMEIDGQWESCPGDLAFNTQAFPNPTALVQALDFLQFRVSLRVHPFCNVNCRTFKRGARAGRWVLNSTRKPAIVEWWNGVGSIIDVTNESTALWWTKRLRQVQLEHGVHTFKFDGGEASWIPDDAILAAPERLQPNAYSTKYARIAARFGKWAGIRVAHRSHSLPLLVRILDQSSSDVTSSSDQLRSLIPTVLHCSLLGYPFVAPEAIAARGRHVIPDREVYIRWMQVSAFLPAMRFSVPPWDYDAEVVDLAHRMVALHQHYVPYIKSLATVTIKDGTPLVRPLWWIAPHDQIAQSQDSEFLIGDELLVAPIVQRGMRQRDIYLPQGVWQDEVQGGIISGPAWLWNYPVQLNQVPHFTRLGKYLR